jgi:hypothetical protein
MPQKTPKPRKKKAPLTFGEQPRYRGIVCQGEIKILPPNPDEKPFRDWTWTEKWVDRRYRWLTVMPTRLTAIDAGFDGLVNCANKETYQFTESEATALVAYLRAWVDALDESLKARKVLRPRNQMPVVLDLGLDPPEDAIPAPDELRDIW